MEVTCGMSIASESQCSPSQPSPSHLDATAIASDPSLARCCVTEPAPQEVQGSPVAVKDNLDLCVNDLLHPSEKAESILETLTTEQLTVIENTLFKIRERKTQSDTQVSNTVQDTPMTTEPQGVTTATTQTASASNEEGKTASGPLGEDEWSWAASQVAKALVDAISSSGVNPAQASSQISNGHPTMNDEHASSGCTPSSVTSTNNTSVSAAAATLLSSHEPVTEIRDGVEWVSFVYSHHRILRRYCIRTDLDQVELSQLDERFKRDNCVYPRANLPRETYRGNRWAYETECNLLGWKLAWLNASEIAGKRGLIQRAVDSYRNRYPSMRSRRVARQEKLLNGTLRKRKHRDMGHDENPTESCFVDHAGLPLANPHKYLKPSPSKTERFLPKTIAVDDSPLGTKCRIRINIESVPLEVIDMPFRKSNCVFPRAMNITPDTPAVTQRQLDEAMCNELGWKLAWLNPRQLANRKSTLQRVLDIYRTKFAPHLKPRKYSSRTAPPPLLGPLTSPATFQVPVKLELTEEALAARQQFDQPAKTSRDLDELSFHSGTTVSLDFHDCFSPPAEGTDSPVLEAESLPEDESGPNTTATATSSALNQANLSLLFPSSTSHMALDSLAFPADGSPGLPSSMGLSMASFPLSNHALSPDDMSCELSVESGSASSSNTPSSHNSPSHVPLMTDFEDLYRQTAFSLGDSSIPSNTGLFDMSLFGDPSVTVDNTSSLLKPYIAGDAMLSDTSRPVVGQCEQDTTSDQPSAAALMSQLF